MTFTTDQILDLDPAAGGLRRESFVFDLLDQDHTVLERLDVAETANPRVRLDTARTIMRTCTSVEINNLPAINVFRNRVQPSMVLSNGDVLPLGVFMFGNDDRTQHSWGERATPELFDETFLVNQTLDRNRGRLPGASVLDLLVRLLQEVGISNLQIDVEDQMVSQAILYQVGSSRMQAVRQLTLLLGAFPPFITNAGICRIKPLPDPTAPPDFVYESGGRIIADTPGTSNSIYQATNEYVATGDSPTGPLVGRYELPAVAPNSYAQTGRRIVMQKSFQGLANQVAANMAAYQMALTDRRSFFKASFSAAADPRHDVFDIVELYGDRYVEIGWDLECVAGGQHAHSLTRFWEPD